MLNDEEYFLNPIDIEASNMASNMQPINKNKKGVTVSVADPVVPTSAVLWLMLL